MGLDDYYEPKNGNNEEYGKGYCCVIANFYLSDEDQAGERLYTQAHVNEIAQFFETKLGYTFHSCNNLTKQGFKEKLIGMQQTLKEGNFDRFFLFVLSHGSEHGINMCSDETGKEFEKDENGKLVFITVEQITSCFDHSIVESLKRYPKCIFIHACRGIETTRVAADPDLGKEPSFTINVDPNDATTDEMHKIDESDVDDDKNFDVSMDRVKRPSSEDFLVAFSCLMGTATYVHSKVPYIHTLIKTFETNYKTEHLLDMTVHVTGQSGGEKFKYEHLPVVFDADSKKSLVVVEGDGETNCHVINSDGNKVVQFGKYKGFIMGKEQTVEPWHVLKCRIQFNGVNVNQVGTQNYLPTVEVAFPAGHIKELLATKYISLADSGNNCLLSDNGETIGVGKITLEEDGSIQIENTVEKCTKQNYYIGNSDRKILDTGRKVFRILEESDFSKDKKCLAEGSIKEIKNGIPKMTTELCQLPIFETTFTKKFYLCKEKVDDKLEKRVTYIEDALLKITEHGIHQPGTSLTGASSGNDGQRDFNSNIDEDGTDNKQPIKSKSSRNSISKRFRNFFTCGSSRSKQNQ